MRSQSTTQISRPLPPTRPIPPTPPRGTIYVVERFGRFSRLLPGSGPPLLPLVDRVIAAYARRVDQATPAEGLLAVIPPNKRVFVHAKWSVRVTDPRKLAYRITHVDRCVDMLVHVRIRDTLSTIPPTADLDDPAVLKRVSEAIRAGVDATAARFGVSCPHFKVLTLRLVKEKPQRSLNLADISPLPDYYSNGIETVLPELPRDATDSAIHSFSSVPSLPPPININYPQPIAYPQPPQPPRRPPALASVRLPPPLPPSSPPVRDTPVSDDESLYRLHDSSEMLPRSQSYRELPTPLPHEQEPDERPESHQMYHRTQSLPQLRLSDDERLDSVQHASNLGEKAALGVTTPPEEPRKAIKLPLEEELDEETMGALPVSDDDESVRPLPLQLTQPNVQELPRDTSYLTDETAPPAEPPKRQILYAPPPSPTVPTHSAKNSSVMPEALSNALVTDIGKSVLSVTETRGPTPPERTSPPTESVSRPSDGTSLLPEHMTPLQEGGKAPPSHEEISVVPDGNSALPERLSALPEQLPAPAEWAPPSEVVLAPQKDASSSESIPTPPGRVLPPPEHVSPPTEHMSPPMERMSPPPERASPPLEHVLPSQPSEQVMLSTERMPPCEEGESPFHEQELPLPEQNSHIPLTTSPQPVSLPRATPIDEFSPPLASVFSNVAPTPHSELPSSERSSDPPSDSQGAPTALSPSDYPNGPRKVNILQDQASDSTDASYKDTVDQHMSSPLAMGSEVRSADHGEPGVLGLQSSQTAQTRSVEQPPQVSHPSQTPTPLSVHTRGPLLGPPMIPIQMHSARERQPALPATASSHLGSQTGDPSLMSQMHSLSSIPPRAPTPPMIPLPTSVRGAASGQVSSGSQHDVGVNQQISPFVAAEGLGPSPTDPIRPLPLNVGATHAAEVDSRAKHAVSRVPHSLYGDEAIDRYIQQGDSAFSMTEAVRGMDAGSESEDNNMATGPRLITSPTPNREPRKRRQYVPTASLFPAVVGKTEKLIKPASASITSDVNQMPSPNTASGAPKTAPRDFRTAVHFADSQPQPKSIREGVDMGELEARRQASGISQAMRADPAALQEREMQRRGAQYVREEVHPGRDGKRLRTTEEEEALSRREHARREKLMNELDSIQGRGAAGSQSSDDDSTRMMIDGGSDEERERFDDEVMSQSGAHLRRRREKTRHRRRHARHEDGVFDTDGSSSEEVCTDCGSRHYHHEGHGSSSYRRGRSKSRSKQSEGSHRERAENDSETRSVSRSRSGRERKSMSETSVDSHRSGKSSSRDRHRSKKSSSRDRKIEKSSSSTRSRSRDGKRSHSKSRSSSSRKRDGEDKKRKESKSKSRNRDKRGQRTEQLEYMYQETEVKSIYRHRLPESESGSENPIPWYCEGQSEPEDTDLDDEVYSNDSDNGKRTKMATMYSSYGRRDRRGRRHRARHNRRVTFLYDDQR